MNLCEASRNGDITAVNKLLANGADPDSIPNGFHSAPLIYAASKGHLDVVKALVDKGADINTREPSGQTPLSVSIEAEQNVVVNFLLGKGADLNSADDCKYTPLHLASRYGNVEATQKLLVMGANQELKDFQGKTASQWWSSRGNRKEKIKMAFENQPYLDQPLQASLCKASSDGDLSTVKASLANGAAPNITSIGCELTPLHHAAFKGHLDVVKTLLADGAQINTKDHLGDTPLVFAIKSSHNEVANFLLAYGANPNIPGKNKLTPLHHATLTGNQEVTKVLLACGANQELKDKYGRTSLECARINPDKMDQAILNLFDQPRSQRDSLCEACKRGDLNAVVKLLANGIDPDFYNDSGMSPLHLSAMHGHLDVVKTLLAKGAQVNTQFSTGETPLFFAVGFGNDDDVINVLLTYGANPNIPGFALMTPLHHAALQGKVTATKILLANGANRNLKDMDGRTAFMCAKGVRKEEIQEVFHNHCCPSQEACARTGIHTRLIEHRTNTEQTLSTAIEELPLHTPMKPCHFNPLTL